MSIDKVEVTNSRGNLLTLTLDDVSNGYVVREIGGLDPVKATIVTSNFATMDGQQYQASSREIRNITLQLGYAPDFSNNQTIRILRSGLYQFFMSKSQVSLTFYMTDGLVVTTTGRVESCEAPLFVKEPQTDISILCMDPDFVSSELIELHDTFHTTDTDSTTIDYDGTVPAGFTSIRFTAARTLSEFTIYHTSPAGVLSTMLVSAPLVIGDIVNICTIKGQKSITLTRGSVISSLLWAVAPGEWIELEPGPNEFYLNASLTDSSPVFVDYYSRYGGL